MSSSSVFTDGSCPRNGSADALAGWAMIWPDAPHKDASGPVLREGGQAPTSNRAELTAVIRALEAWVSEDASGTARWLTIYSDSKLVVRSANEWLPGWKACGWTRRGSPLKNVDLLKRLDGLLARARAVSRVELVHVRAHTGGSNWEARMNDLADKAAGAAVLAQRTTP
jgi:ribonuclease HI